jgi:hypothetical protein
VQPKLKKAASFQLPVSHAAYHRLFTASLAPPSICRAGTAVLFMADIGLGMFACFVDGARETLEVILFHRAASR